MRILNQTQTNIACYELTGMIGNNIHWECKRQAEKCLWVGPTTMYDRFQLFEIPQIKDITG